jgi:hypothetical protein
MNKIPRLIPTRWALVAATFLLGGLGSCSASNVTPHNSDYPRLNPNPTRFIELHVTLPSTLKVRFNALYFAGQPDCQFSVGIGALEPYFARLPVQLHSSADMQSGTVAMDGYLPGRCQWYFRAIEYRMLDGTPEDDRDLGEGAQRAKTGVVAGSTGKYEGPVHLWCSAHREYKEGAAISPQCSNWVMASGWNHTWNVSDSEHRNDPGSIHRDEIETTIHADTKVVEVHFHDIDVEGATHGQ